MLHIPKVVPKDSSQMKWHLICHLIWAKSFGILNIILLSLRSFRLEFSIRTIYGVSFLHVFLQILTLLLDIVLCLMQ